MLRCSTAFLFLACAVTTGCATVRFDLDRLPFPVSASPYRGDPQLADRFTMQEKHVLWLHGLVGETQPDVQGQLLANCLPCAGLADFRVSTTTTFHDWLVTHLTLGFVRMKSVTVTGVRIRPLR